MDRVRAREVARFAVPKVAAVALAIGTDALAETAGVAVVLWRLARRVTTLERDLADLAARVARTETAWPR